MAAADETTENFAEVMNEALADAAKAEAERDALATRVAELEPACCSQPASQPATVQELVERCHPMI